MTAAAEFLSDDDLADLLERDYRHQLRWYPRSWRAAHGDALIGTLMDEADDDDRFTMRRGEWRTFAAAGFAARLDVLVMRPVRDAAATVTLTMGAGIALASMVLTSWAPWRSADPAFGPFSDAEPVLAVFWAVALVSAVIDRWWIGRVALLVSIGAVILMRPVETALAPAQFVVPDSGTLTLSATCALLAAIGTPKTGLPLVAASAGWAGLACLAHGYQRLAGDGPSSAPTDVLLQDPTRTSWAIALVLGVAGVLAITGFRRAAFTVLLTVVPAVAALEVQNVPQSFWPPASYLLIAVPVIAGFIALVVASRRGSRHSDGTTTTRAHPGRPVLVAAIAASVVVLVGAAGALTAAGLDWAAPTAVDWSRYWQQSASGPWPDWAKHPDVSLDYRLPRGGTCTIRIDITDLSATSAPSAGALAARSFLRTGADDGTLIDDPHIEAAVREDPLSRDVMSNFWGIEVRPGRGTPYDDTDVEYFEAVGLGLSRAASDHVEQVGASPDDYAYTFAQRCGGTR